MRVFELMNELSKLPAGAIVKVNLLRDTSELPVSDEENDTREISCEINSVDHSKEDTVFLSD